MDRESKQIPAEKIPGMWINGGYQNLVWSTIVLNQESKTMDMAVWCNGSSPYLQWWRYLVRLRLLSNNISNSLLIKVLCLERPLMWGSLGSKCSRKKLYSHRLNVLERLNVLNLFRTDFMNTSGINISNSSFILVQISSSLWGKFIFVFIFFSVSDVFETLAGWIKWQ